MREAAMFAAIGQSALLVGALLVWRFRGLTRPRSYVVQALTELRRLSASSRTPQDPVGL